MDKSSYSKQIEELVASGTFWGLDPESLEFIDAVRVFASKVKWPTQPTPLAISELMWCMFYNFGGDTANHYWFTEEHRDILCQSIWEFFERAEEARLDRQQTDILSNSIQATAEQKLAAFISIYWTDEYGPMLESLPYKDFLNTDYWKLVSSVVKKRDRSRCSLCFKVGSLNAHHKTYEHHGWEHEHLEDLISLCGPCHQKFHDKLPTRGVSH